MNRHGVNWPGLAAVVLGGAALLSYPLLFVRWPITRDIPWANGLLFGLAALLAVKGVRRSFAPSRWRWLRVAFASVLAALTAGTFAAFVYGVLIVPSRLPASPAAPGVGQQAPGFTLADTRGAPVSLQDLMASRTAGARPSKAVLLIFYRGYW